MWWSPWDHERMYVQIRWWLLLERACHREASPIVVHWFWAIHRPLSTNKHTFYVLFHFCFAALPRDSLTVAEKLASMGLQTANNRRQQQMVGLLFFLSMWFTLTAFSWFPYILSVISFDPVAVDTFALSSPLVGILQSIAAVLGLMFALLAFIVTQIEIYKMTQLQQEIKVQCELDSQKWLVVWNMWLHATVRRWEIVENDKKMIWSHDNFAVSFPVENENQRWVQYHKSIFHMQ